MTTLYTIQPQPRTAAEVVDSLYRHSTGTAASRIALPAPGDARGLSLEDAIRQWRSIRTYTGTSMTQEALSRLLFHTDGITTERGGTRLRAAPSAGALYPIETYVVVHRVEGVEAGVYHYAVQDHARKAPQGGV